MDDALHVSTRFEWYPNGKLVVLSILAIAIIALAVILWLRRH
jgi:hypothetical protein